MKNLHPPITDKNKSKLEVFQQFMIRLCCMFIAVFLCMSALPNMANGATGIKIYDYSTKKTSTYTDKQISVTLNGTKLSSMNVPGILSGGIALLPYDDVFQNSIIAAKCTYNESKGTITISKYNTTINMTIGSSTAKVNGKSVKLSAVPKKVKFTSLGVTKVLVPSRFVSEALGLGYTWNSSTSIVAIQKSTILLSYNGGAAFEYSGAKGKVTVDGKKVSLGTMPSIIVNNTAMLRASKVFTCAGIGASYSFDKSTNQVSLSKDKNIITMTIGSKTAYLNDKKVTLSSAPMIVRNCETNSNYVMVPGSVTATGLGFAYSWNNQTRTSVISTRSAYNDPELGDSGDISETGTILNEWTATSGQYASAQNIHSVNSNAAVTDNPGLIYSVNRDYSKTTKNSETFTLTATAPFHKVNASDSGNTITLDADGILCNPSVQQLYGTSSNFINTLTMTNHTDSKGMTITLTLMQDKYRYDISLSPDNMMLYITVYYNAITSATIGTNQNGDYLIINSIDALNPTVTDANGYITVDLPATVNIVGDIAASISGSQFITQFLSANSADKTQLILSLKSGYKYYCSQSGNKFTLILQLSTTTADTGNYDVLIPKPPTLDSSMISDSDHYASNYFVVTLQGDYTGSISADKIVNRSSVVKNISVTLNSSNNTEIKITTTKLQGYKISSDGSGIYIDIGDPTEIYKNIVVLDPGHGGTDTGAISSGYNEKDFNFKILYTVGRKIFNQDPSKLKVYYTRTTDTFITLADRAAFANKVGADLFVSLHMNAAGSIPNASGTEAFYSKENNSPNCSGLTSKQLATTLLSNLYPAIGTVSRGVKEEGLYVTKHNTVPAVLLEFGFITNSKDLSIITDESKQEIAMQSLYNSLLQLFEQYPTGR